MMWEPKTIKSMAKIALWIAGFIGLISGGLIYGIANLV